MKNIVIVLPTYNERENIVRVLDLILAQQSRLPNSHLQVLVVDDSSPDGTGEVVKEYTKTHRSVYLMNGKKKGLGDAYLRGFSAALDRLNADVVFEMDADLSHNPNDLPRFIKLIEQGYEFVIGSRYTKGGSIPEEWPLLRKLNSKIGNIVAQYIGGMGKVDDATSGFRAISALLLKRMDLRALSSKGYAFQIELLNKAIQSNARIAEIPIRFVDRIYGESKLRIKDVTEFIKTALRMRYVNLKPKFRFIPIVFFSVPLYQLGALPTFDLSTDLVVFGLSLLSIVLIFQSISNIYTMIFAWESPHRVLANKSPDVFVDPKYSFTALLPVRHEEKVIGDTIRAVANIDYPHDKKEIIIICRTDDPATIDAAQATINDLHDSLVKLVTFSDEPINKPHGLNVGLQHAHNDVIVIFDAEDEPHKDIYSIVNTVMVDDAADVVQAGVQLMNYRSKWFSMLNVLEYFFWFKSALHFFTTLGLTPLGGNTVFFKRDWLNRVGGWNEECLTEDAEIGIALSEAGAKIRIVYDEKHATQEETPTSMESFIKQRTRWNQGYLQVFKNGSWLHFPTLKQRILGAYLLIWPHVQTVLFLYVPISIVTMLVIKLPVWLALLTTAPLYLLFVQFVILNIGLYEFTRDYNLPYRWWMPLHLLVTFIPYQLLLGVSAMRAVVRFLRGNTSWEKTLHINAHRTANKPSLVMSES